MKGPKLKNEPTQLEIQQAYLQSLLKDNPGKKLSTQMVLNLLEIQSMPKTQAKVDALYKFNTELHSSLTTPQHKVPKHIAQSIMERAKAEIASEQITPFSFTESTLSGESKKIYNLIQNTHPNFFKEIDEYFKSINISQFQGEKIDYKKSGEFVRQLDDSSSFPLNNLSNTTPEKNQLLSYILQQRGSINNQPRQMTFSEITIFIPLILSTGETLDQRLSVGFDASTGKPLIRFE